MNLLFPCSIKRSSARCETMVAEWGRGEKSGGATVWPAWGRPPKSDQEIPGANALCESMHSAAPYYECARRVAWQQDLAWLSARAAPFIVCVCAIVAVALTDPHASLTLNVLVVYAINVVSAAPCVACLDSKSGACCEEHRCPNAPFNPKCAGAIRRMASAPE